MEILEKLAEQYLANGEDAFNGLEAVESEDGMSVSFSKLGHYIALGLANGANGNTKGVLK